MPALSRRMGAALPATPRNDAVGKRGLAGMFLYLFSREPLRIGAIVVCGLVSGISSVALIALVNDVLVAREYAAAVWTYVGLCVLAIGAHMLSQLLLGQVSQRAIADLRGILSARVLDMPLLEIERYGTARIVGLLSADITVVAAALLNLPVVGIDAIVIVSCMVYLAWLSPSMFVPVLATAVLGVVLYWSVAIRAGRSYRKASALEETLYRHFGDLTEGVKELKLNAARRDAFVGETLDSTIEACRKELLTGRAFTIGAFSIGQLLLFVLVGVVLAYLSTGAESRVASGYVLLVLYMMVPFSTLMSMAPLMIHAAASWGKIGAFSAHVQGARESFERSAMAVPLPESWECIRLDAVTFSYRGDERDNTFTLGPLDLRVCRGEVLFVVGGNGSGKTTLAKILTGLYEIDGGAIRVDGSVVGAGSLPSYRESFSAVFTDFHLFERLTGPGSRVEIDERARGLIGKLRLTGHVDVDRGTLSTLALSHGQRKRLALLAAFLEDRAVYVFDEWAADQDPAFRQVFYNEVIAELKAAGKAVVVISHDDRFFHCADRIVRLEYGKIVPAAVTA